MAGSHVHPGCSSQEQSNDQSTRPATAATSQNIGDLNGISSDGTIVTVLLFKTVAKMNITNRGRLQVAHLLLLEATLWQDLS